MSKYIFKGDRKWIKSKRYKLEVFFVFYILKKVWECIGRNGPVVSVQGL